MYVSAIQGQLTNSTQGMQAKKMPYSVGVTKDLVTDSFSREEVMNISFRGTGNAIKGGIVTTAVVGTAVALTGGLAAVAAVPLLTWLGVIGTGAAVGAINPDEDDDNDSGQPGGLQLPPSV